MDFMPRRPRIDKDGKVILKADGEPEMTRGTERLLIGSNGSIYLTLDHYHTFILLIDQREMMSYTSKYPGLFKAPLFIRESGYWQNHMAPYLEVEGWAVIVVDCAGVTSIQEFAYRLVESIDNGYPYPEGFNLRWASEEACLIRNRDMRQGLFILYKNFEDILVLDNRKLTACVNIIETMDEYYSVRPSFGNGLYQVLFGYGVEISQESLPHVKEFFEDNIVVAASDVKYPWDGAEKFKKTFFPNGFPDPRYEDGSWVMDPDEYPESTSYVGDNKEDLSK